MLYWIYLIDPITAKPLKRNYLKLYTDRKYLYINLALSAILFLINQPFTSLPLFLILMILLINKMFLYFFNRNFVFILRGDPVNKRFPDLIFSIFLLFIPFAMSVVMFFMLTKQ